MSELESRMAEFTAHFVSRASQEREQIAAARKVGDTQSLREQAHKLAGIAAIFGYPAIGDAAFSLEVSLEKGEDFASQADELERLLTTLAQEERA